MFGGQLRLVEGEEPIIVRRFLFALTLRRRSEFAGGYGGIFMNIGDLEPDPARRGVVIGVDSDSAPEFFFSLSQLGKFEVRLRGSPPPAQSASNGGYAYAIDVVGHEAFDAAAEYRGDRLDSQDGGIWRRGDGWWCNLKQFGQLTQERPLRW